MLFGKFSTRKFWLLAAAAGLVVKKKAAFRLLPLVVMLFMTAACENPSTPPAVSLTGTWRSTYGDTYVITDNFLRYDDGFGGGYSGNIRAVSWFTSNSGVIIIEYTTDGKAQYYEYDEDWNVTGTFDPPGNFQGVYFRGITSNSIQLANAYDDQIDTVNHGAPETTSLKAAKEKFTLDNVDGFVSRWGTYERR
ncbi:MAG: hypothetical protein LBN92_00525 [Treponema sp.]|jgi:hypothetical protein|nr:hypothetical protein [Treponema sp.]